MIQGTGTSKGLRLSATLEAEIILREVGFVLPTRSLPILRAGCVIGDKPSTVREMLRKHNWADLLEDNTFEQASNKILVIMEPVPNRRQNALYIPAFFWTGKRNLVLRPVKAQVVVNGRIIDTLMIQPEDSIMVLDFAS